MVCSGFEPRYTCDLKFSDWLKLDIEKPIIVIYFRPESLLYKPSSILMRLNIDDIFAKNILLSDLDFMPIYLNI